jgi:hypothetical protein
VLLPFTGLFSDLHAPPKEEPVAPKKGKVTSLPFASFFSDLLALQETTSCAKGGGGRNVVLCGLL